MIASERVRTAAAMALVAVALVVLLRGLALDGFFVGDAGVKLIAARAAATTPSRPLDVPIPIIAGQPRADYLEPFFRPHGDHAHAVTSPLFPLLIAPLVAWFGLTGAYAIPVLALLLTIPATAALSRSLGFPGGGLPAGLATAILSPLIFYGLEIWEHSAAACCFTAAAAMALNSPRRPMLDVAAGVLGGVAVLLRPEALISFAVLVGLLVSRRVPLRSTALILLAALLSGLPLMVYNWMHTGTPFGVHAATNFSAVAPDWLATRWSIVQLWFLEVGRRENLWRVFPLAIVAVACPRFDRAGRSAWVLAGMPVLGVILLAPNDGGGQWGPRYLLMMVPVVSILAVDSLDRLRQWSRGTWVRRVPYVLALLLAVYGLWVTRDAYRELRGSKRLAVDVARSVAGTGDRVVVTSVWWLDQLCAARVEQTILFVRSPEHLASLIRLLAAAETPGFSWVAPRGSAEWMSGEAPGPFVSGTQITIQSRDLTATRYSRREPLDLPPGH